MRHAPRRPRLRRFHFGQSAVKVRRLVADVRDGDLLWVPVAGCGHHLFPKRGAAIILGAYL
jgi:hypothetical protein